MKINSFTKLISYFRYIKMQICLVLNLALVEGVVLLSIALVTLGYVRCQDLKKSFDSPDQLVMVIRAPPETQMQVSEPSKVSGRSLSPLFKTRPHSGRQICHMTPFSFFLHPSPGLPGVPEEHARAHRRLPLPGGQLRCLQPRDGKQPVEARG